MSAKSARGLFAATGKTPRAVAVRAGDGLPGSYEMAEGLAREADDFYPTPPAPTLALLSAEGKRLRAFDAIWEPAAGDGAMVRAMEGFGLKVVASDLIDRGCGAAIRSFYDFDTAPAAAIVTNPPFKECQAVEPIKARWIRHALDHLGVAYMALLLPWPWPGAAGHGALWHEHAPARVHLMRWRIDFTGQGASPMLNAWFVWDGFTPPGETRLLVMDRSDPAQGEIFEGAA